MSSVKRTRDGGIEVRLGRHEATLIADLVRQYAQLLEVRVGASGTQAADPALARLFPAAFQDLGDAAEFRRADEDRALALRLTDARRLAALEAGRTAYDREGAIALMRSVNGVRLVVATRLGIFTEEDAARTPALGQPMQAVHAWLGMLLEQIVAALGVS